MSEAAGIQKCLRVFDALAPRYENQATRQALIDIRSIMERLLMSAEMGPGEAPPPLPAPRAPRKTPKLTRPLKWTQGQRDEVKRLADAGVTRAEISTRTGIPLGTVHSILKGRRQP